MDVLLPLKKKIILVEDDPDLRIVYSTVLSGKGFDVQVAPEGELGLEMIKKKDWDLLLLDIMVPKMDGIQILKVIRDEKLKKGKILAITNLNNQNIIEEVFSLGVDGYISKSDITPGRLVEEVKGYLS